MPLHCRRPLRNTHSLAPAHTPRQGRRIFVAGAVYEMACGHCRRPRKEILAFNFGQLCWIRGLSSSPKSQGGSKVVLRGSKIAPEIASWDPENSPGRPETHPGRALALPTPQKAPGSVRAAADCTPPGGGPGDTANQSAAQPTSPQALENSSSTLLLVPGALSLPRPHTLDGVGGFPGQRPHAPTLEEKSGRQAHLSTEWSMLR